MRFATSARSVPYGENSCHRICTAVGRGARARSGGGGTRLGAARSSAARVPRSATQTPPRRNARGAAGCGRSKGGRNASSALRRAFVCAE